MARFDGCLARTLDFGDSEAPGVGGKRLASQGPAIGAGAESHTRGRFPSPRSTRASVGAAPCTRRGPGFPAGPLRGPDKYRALEHRRRHAQMKARRMLAALD